MEKIDARHPRIVKPLARHFLFWDRLIGHVLDRRPPAAFSNERPPSPRDIAYTAVKNVVAVPWIVASATFTSSAHFVEGVEKQASSDTLHHPFQRLASRFMGEIVLIGERVESNTSYAELVIDA